MDAPLQTSAHDAGQHTGPAPVAVVSAEAAGEQLRRAEQLARLLRSHADALALLRTELAAHPRCALPLGFEYVLVTISLVITH